MIDKAGLHRLPICRKTPALRGGKSSDFQTFHARFSIRQLRFGLVFGPMHKNSPVVFRPKTIAETRGGLSAISNVKRNANNDDQNDHNCASN
jgi:hypothetical protein